MKRHRVPLQRGQALTEFLVIALALVPLFLLLPMIGKYQDIRHSTQMASRYVAFEAVTYNDGTDGFRSAGELALDVRRRFFSDAGAPIKTGDAAGDFKAHQNLAWRDPQDRPLIANFDQDVRVGFGDADAADPAAGFSKASDSNAFSLNGPLSLKARGIHTAGVSVRIANLPARLAFYEPFDQLDLQITRRTSVLIDHWSGRDAGDVQRHLDDKDVNAGVFLKPSALPVRALVYAQELLPWGTVTPPQLGELDFWKDTVPKDRLRQ